MKIIAILLMNVVQKAQFCCLPIALAMALLMIVPGNCFPHGAITTIYIVRRAEKIDNTPDALISNKGKVRAKELGHVLQDVRLDAKYVSTRKRTMESAEPTKINNTGIVPQAVGKSDDIVKAILSAPGARVLVVGHSDTVNKIAAGLGVNAVSERGANQFDRLFVVNRLSDRAFLQFLRYGEPTD